MNLSKTLSKQAFLLAGLVGLGFFLAPIPYRSPAPSGVTPFPTDLSTSQEEKNPGLPVRLKIPKINVDSAIEYVGLTYQGDMDAPKGPATTGWYNQGPRPGEKGSSVIDGHLDWEDGKPAVFADLYKLHKGDKLFVVDEKGATTTFVVRESRRYEPEADATAVFRSSDGKAHLNLITCEGSWDKIQKSYSTRLVVFTDKESG